MIKDKKITDIEELRRIEAESTPGPWLPEWELSKDNFCQVSAFSEDGNRILQNAIKSFKPVEDATLIVAMRNALPELLKALEASLPQEPTDAMIEAGEEALLEGREWGMRVYAADIYSAMVKARGGVDVG